MASVYATPDRSGERLVDHPARTRLSEAPECVHPLQISSSNEGTRSSPGISAKCPPNSESHRWPTVKIDECRITSALLPRLFSYVGAAF